MLILKESVLEVPIMSLQTGEEIARTASLIIDPRQLVIVAFYCEGQRLDHNPSVLHIEDIREVSEMGFIVNGAEALMTPEDLVRLQEIINFKFELDGKMVIDDTGKKIGKVHDYGIDNKTFQIMQLRVTPQLWQALQTTDVIIGRHQIIKVTNQEIVVKAPTIKAGAGETDPKPMTTNPFRRAPATPEPAPTTTDQAPS